MLPNESSAVTTKLSSLPPAVTVVGLPVTENIEAAAALTEMTLLVPVMLLPEAVSVAVSVWLPAFFKVVAE